MFNCDLQEEDSEMSMNFERRRTGLETKIKLLSESLAKEKKTKAGMKSFGNIEKINIFVLV